MNITSDPVARFFAATTSASRAAQGETDFAQLLLGSGPVDDRQFQGELGSREQERDGKAETRFDASAWTAVEQVSSKARTCPAEQAAKSQGPEAGTAAAAGRLEASGAATRAALPDELLPMTGHAQGRLSYLAREGEGAFGMLTGSSGRFAEGGRASRGTPGPAWELAGSNALARAGDGAALPSLEVDLAGSATEAAVADAQDAVALPPAFEQLDPILRRRISMTRHEQELQVRIRDYRMTDAERAEIVKHVVAALPRNEINGVRIVINGRDYAVLGAAALQREPAHAD